MEVVVYLAVYLALFVGAAFFLHGLIRSAVAQGVAQALAKSRLASDVRVLAEAADEGQRQRERAGSSDSAQ